MIKLRKHAEPQVLHLHGASWLKALQDKIESGEIPTDTEKSRYRHPEIKTALKLETNGKCAYCESRLLHIAFGDVEHISPKSLKVADTFRWDNLTLACDVCNTYKKDAIDIVDPYVDEPETFFKFLGPLMYAHPEHRKGVVTVKQLRLNRPDLLENRNKRLEAISSIVLTIRTVSDHSVRKALINDLLDNEAADQAEYAAFVRSFIAAIGSDLVKDPA